MELKARRSRGTLERVEVVAVMTLLVLVAVGLVLLALNLPATEAFRSVPPPYPAAPS